MWNPQRRKIIQITSNHILEDIITIITILLLHDYYTIFYFYIKIISWYIAICIDFSIHIYAWMYYEYIAYPPNKMSMSGVLGGNHNISVSVWILQTSIFLVVAILRIPAILFVFARPAPGCQEQKGPAACGYPGVRGFVWPIWKWEEYRKLREHLWENMDNYHESRDLGKDWSSNPRIGRREPFVVF